MQGWMQFVSAAGCSVSSSGQGDFIRMNVEAGELIVGEREEAEGEEALEKSSWASEWHASRPSRPRDKVASERLRYRETSFECRLPMKFL